MKFGWWNKIFIFIIELDNLKWIIILSSLEILSLFRSLFRKYFHCHCGAWSLRSRAILVHWDNDFWIQIYKSNFLTTITNLFLNSVFPQPLNSFTAFFLDVRNIKDYSIFTVNWRDRIKFKIFEKILCELMKYIIKKYFEIPTITT